MSETLELGLTPQQRAEANEADRRARQSLALLHYSGEAAKAAQQRETSHERIARKLAELLAEVNAQHWADESIALVVEDLEAAVTHWQCVYPRDTLGIYGEAQR